jgi:hypothetical protein
MRDGYIGWAARGGSAQLTLVRGKNPPLPPLFIHMNNTILTYMAVTPSGEGRGNGKKPIWVWGALRGKGRKG